MTINKDLLSWSALSPKPVVDRENNLCYWFGCVLPTKTALSIAMNIFCNASLTPQQREELEKDFLNCVDAMDSLYYELHPLKSDKIIKYNTYCLSKIKSILIEKNLISKSDWYCNPAEIFRHFFKE